MDSILGALALGDIGKYFSDQDNQYKDIDSKLLLEKVYYMMEEKNYVIGNIDVTIVAQKPKLEPYSEKMREVTSSILHCDINQINVSATTEEKLGFTGDGSAIAAHAVCLVKPIA